MLTNKAIKSTKKSFFYTFLGFTQSHLGSLGDIEGFIQKIPGTYKIGKTNNYTGIDKTHIRADCADGSILDGVRHLILYSFALEKSPGHIV